MKYEESRNLSTILVESSDKRATVMTQISMQSKPVVLVVPAQASEVFQQPMHFADLRHLRREMGISITVVITGHERLRNLARRQGFPVYASQETCARALARRDRLYALRGLNLAQMQHQGELVCDGGDDDDDDVPWSWDVKAEMQEVAQRCAAPGSVLEMSPVLDAGASAEWQRELGEPLWDVSWRPQLQYPQNGSKEEVATRRPLLSGEYTSYPKRSSDFEAAETTRTTASMLPVPMGALASFGNMTSTRPLRPTRLVGFDNVEEHADVDALLDDVIQDDVIQLELRSAPNTEPLSEWDTRPQFGEKLRLPLGAYYVNNTVVWILVALLVLGILGGIGFAYLSR